MASLFKRIVVGQPLSTHVEMEHRLPKRIALTVFSSDALSSTAYATDEILLVLAAGAAAALHFAPFISLAVVVVMAVVVFSYRQTVEAYPQGGGAYRVAHENLGAPAGLIAGSALLIDYVLTVSVSIAAGVAAAGAALEGARDHRVVLALAAVAVICALNLRGMKESGGIFAVPTYGFLVAMGTVILIGVYKAMTGNIEHVEPSHLEATQAVTLFMILRAFASGSTALTGIEAISDGVPAFQPPEAKNASQTLLILGVLLGILFLGITYLSREIGVDPHLIEEGQTVTSQITAGVFGSTSWFFYVVQAFTALILFLAANTAYADFPRLASILAKDRYLPRGLSQRGDRLAFSNGILILTAAAAGLLINYEADVHRIVPLYVVGVFTSFSLSQAGMVVHTLRAKRRAESLRKDVDRRWKRKVFISGFGATTTFIVLIIVGITKFFTPLAEGEAPHFRGGAWQIIVLIPCLATVLAKINKHYRHVENQLSFSGSLPDMRSEKVVLVVSRFRGATKALAIARAIAPRELRAIAWRCSEQRLADLRNRWEGMGVTTPIEPVGDNISEVLRVVREMDPRSEDPVTLMFPDPHYRTWFGQVFKNRSILKLKRVFLYESGTVLIGIPHNPERDPEPKRLQAPTRLALVVVVSSVNRASMRAIQYARSLNPSELKAMSIQTEPGDAAKLTHEWGSIGVDVPLEVVDAPFRDLMDPLKRELREMRQSPDDAIGVVVPEFVVPRWYQNLLHTQTAFFIKTALLFEDEVIVINVPYRVHSAHKGKPQRPPEEPVKQRQPV
ncbi:MAG TPA: APC family permease [Actinomycetota bacterium]|nr:APC family permease [Actinomycetota bacterium]